MLRSRMNLQEQTAAQMSFRFAENDDCPFSIPPHRRVYGVTGEVNEPDGLRDAIARQGPPWAT